MADSMTKDNNEVYEMSKEYRKHFVWSDDVEKYLKITPKQLASLPKGLYMIYVEKKSLFIMGRHK